MFGEGRRDTLSFMPRTSTSIIYSIQQGMNLRTHRTLLKLHVHVHASTAVKTHFLSIVLLIASKQEVLGAAAVDEHGLLTDEVDSALGLDP